MQSMLLDAAAPLYGRALEALDLRPLPAGLIGAALGLADPVRMVRAYVVWGGIPRYWELVELFGDDLDGSVDALAMDPMGPLHREPDRLLLEVLGRLSPPDLPRKAIRVIFVPSSVSGMTQTRSSVRVVEAGAVLRSLM